MPATAKSRRRAVGLAGPGRQERGHAVAGCGAEAAGERRGEPGLAGRGGRAAGGEVGVAGAGDEERHARHDRRRLAGAGEVGDDGELDRVGRDEADVGVVREAFDEAARVARGAGDGQAQALGVLQERGGALGEDAVLDAEEDEERDEEGGEADDLAGRGGALVADVREGEAQGEREPGAHRGAKVACQVPFAPRVSAARTVKP